MPQSLPRGRHVGLNGSPVGGGRKYLSGGVGFGWACRSPMVETTSAMRLANHDGWSGSAAAEASAGPRNKFRARACVCSGRWTASPGCAPSEGGY